MSEKEIYSFTINTIDSQPINFSNYKNKPLLIVNYASKCGLCESNLKQFTFLKEKFPELEILLFPSNNFKQEYEDISEIKTKIEKVCKKFTIFEITTISGEEINPLFNFLVKNSKGFFNNKIKWNFTKFLINRKGDIVKRISPTSKVSVEDIESIY